VIHSTHQTYAQRHTLQMILPCYSDKQQTISSIAITTTKMINSILNRKKVVESSRSHAASWWAQRFSACQLQEMGKQPLSCTRMGDSKLRQQEMQRSTAALSYEFVCSNTTQINWTLWIGAGMSMKACWPHLKKIARPAIHPDDINVVYSRPLAVILATDEHGEKLQA